MDAARTEAALFGEIGFEVGQQFGAGDLSGSRCNRLGNAYLDQVRSEFAPQAVKADRSCSLRLCCPTQLFRKIGRQCRWCNASLIHCQSKSADQISVFFDRGVFVVRLGKAAHEAVDVRLNAGFGDYRHGFRAP